MDIIVFKGAENRSLLEKIEQHRIQVWRDIVGADVAHTRFSIDSFDLTSWHVVVCGANIEIIGSARLIIASSPHNTPDLCSFGPYVPSIVYPAAFLNRLAVHAQHRHKGVTKLLNNKRHEIAFAQNAQEMWVEARADRKPSLAQIGYECVGTSADESVVGDWLIFRMRIKEVRQTRELAATVKT